VLLVLSGCTTDSEAESISGKTPGQLVTEPIEFQDDPALIAVAQKSLRIRYRSTSGIDGSATVVSGVVFVPTGTAPPTGWPIASIGHATTGVDSGCAPSAYPDLLGELATVTEFLEQGFVVVMSDYQGLGTPGHHPYLEPKSAAYNVIDAVRAAQEVVADASDKWIGYGFSQGGQAVWAANELSSQYGDGLQLLGTISIAPPTDLRPVVDSMENGTLTVDQVELLPLLLKGVQAMHPELHLDDYLRGAIGRRVDVFFACAGEQDAHKSMVAEGVSPADVKPSSPRAAEQLRKWLGEYSLPIRRAAAPMLVGYGDADSIVLPEWTAEGLRRACALNDIVEVRVVKGQGHSVDLGSAAADWVQARQQGVPAPNSCPAE
jgi:alpha-beta hydrolase superfamily lysophospholipase